MNSAQLFDRARKVIPGGVNSPVRAFNSVGGTPVFVESARGTVLTTVEGTQLTDYCCSWGPLILGHAHPEVVKAVTAAASRGTSYGISTRAEVEFAELLCECIPAMDQVRLVSSGTEAVMTALRIARGATGRKMILKFAGCYHGHSDSLLVSAGSGLLTRGAASSAGVSEAVAADTLVAPYNDLDAVGELIDVYGGDLAAIIVEPIAGNMGLTPPAAGFLAGLRKLADKSGAALIFDEVITGFRLGPTTYGEIAGVVPDLTCLGKIIGGGLPIGGVGGRSGWMQTLSPCGDVYQAGTLSGNPVAVAAGMKTVEILRRDNPYAGLEKMASTLARGVNEVCGELGASAHCAQMGSMFTTFFRPRPVRDLVAAQESDTETFARFFHGMLERGIYLSPSQFELGFVSTAHTDADIDQFVTAAADTLQSM